MRTLEDRARSLLMAGRTPGQIAERLGVTQAEALAWCAGHDLAKPMRTPEAPKVPTLPKSNGAARPDPPAPQRSLAESVAQLIASGIEDIEALAKILRVTPEQIGEALHELNANGADVA